MTETTERRDQVGIRLTPEQARWLDSHAARGFGGRAVIVRALIDQAMAEERRRSWEWTSDDLAGQEWAEADYLRRRAEHKAQREADDDNHDGRSGTAVSGTPQARQGEQRQPRVRAS